MHNNSTDVDHSAQLIDLSGKVIAQKVLNPAANNEFDLTNLTAGTYLIKVTKGDTSTLYKVIKE